MLQYMWTIPCLGESGEWMKAQGSQAPWEVTAVAEERAWSGKRGWETGALSAECHVQGPHTGQTVWVTSEAEHPTSKQESPRIYHKVEAHLKWVRSSFMISSQLSINPYSFLKILLSLQLCLRFSQPRSHDHLEGFVLVPEKKKSNHLCSAWLLVQRFLC